MERIVFALLIATNTCCWCEKYVFVKDNDKNWPDARKHCMDHYTDFLALTSEEEEQVFKKFANNDKEGWIGLYWDNPNYKWKWSGGEFVIYHNNLDLPVNLDLPGIAPLRIAENAFWTSKEWKWKSGDDTCNFFCVNMVPVAEEKTWEDALDHCREKNTDLLSLLSFTESQMAQGEIQSSAYTEPVWIGLRYLGNSWMWVNGDPMPYEAWPEGDQDHMCPMLRRCVALTKQGAWESRDCQEKHSFICA
ncbi:CD209 antigen-like protein A [Poecilia reticulata]|uniref:CD209 antigen-like protein A n=1 Tax=Poecilia reticulata TaxID=8081 RepID=UPI0007EA3678|nr:PREDICTED: CD209 antigen-like protein A [Poecilia reticulata]